jgi:hypothetical protein
VTRYDHKCMHIGIDVKYAGRSSRKLQYASVCTTLDTNITWSKQLSKTRKKFPIFRTDSNKSKLHLGIKWPIPMAVLSKAWVCGRSLAMIVGSNPSGGWMDVCCGCCVLSGRGLCDGLIARPEDSYRVCVCVCGVSKCVCF